MNPSRFSILFVTCAVLPLSASRDSGHTGIYLGNGLFLNATQFVDNDEGPEPTAGYTTSTGGVGIKFVPSFKGAKNVITYRTPDGK